MQLNDLCTVIIPTHSAYIGVCNNFITLFRKNWKSCPFKLVVSVTGEDVKPVDDRCEYLYNGKDSTLTGCVNNAVLKYVTPFYMCFLGDAFINQKVDEKWVINTIRIMKAKKIEYCSLICIKNYAKKKSFNQDFRFIHTNDRYSHTFVAYLASKTYVNDVIAKCKTDLEYEQKYLNSGNGSRYYDDHIIVSRNVMGIVPAITKGKWDRFAYAKLVKTNPEICFDDREIEPWKASIYQHVHDRMIALIPDKIRVELKTLLKKYLKKDFVTND